MPSRFAVPIAFLLMLIGSMRIISTYNVFNHTIDEPIHLAAGLQWIEEHRYAFEDLHPPLARVSGALGAYFAGARWAPNPNIFQAGLDILGRDEHYDRLLFYGRLGTLPFFWLAGFVVFVWAKRIAGASVALLALYFFTTTPSILAHAGLLTTDMALVACLGAAFVASLYWSEKPNAVRTVLFGVCLALALLAKFSSVVFLLSIWGARLVVYFLTQRPTFVAAVGKLHRRILPLAGALAVAGIVIWAGYLFAYGSVRFLPIRVPAPAFFTGLYSVWVRNKNGGLSYLLGQTSMRGFWYFFPLTLLIKTPLPMLALLGTSAVAFVRLKLGAPLLFIGCILVPAMVSRINIGTRHVLPIYLAAAVACGVTAYYFLQPERARPLRFAAAALLALQGWISFAAHPNYLAYTNALGGNEPERILVDSDLDWGQDMKRAGARLNELRVKEVSAALSNRGYLSAGHAFPLVHDIPPGKTPPPGWSVVSLTEWKLRGVPEWANDIPPREKIGGSMYLYYFPESR